MSPHLAKQGPIQFGIAALGLKAHLSQPSDSPGDKTMSWEHDHYEATCDGCGRKGVVIRSSDDWNRSRTRYVGFENVEPSPTAIGHRPSAASVPTLAIVQQHALAGAIQ